MEPPEDSGSAEPVFFSSVVPDSATWVASATCAGVVTVADVDPVRGWLNSLNRNISVSTRCTIVFSTLFGIVPFCTAVCSGAP
jgi:hypothetical protein